MRIINKNYSLSSNINANIVLISDIHYYSKGDIKHLNKVLDNIKKTNPKFICIPGDIIDEINIKDEVDFITWLNKLSKISTVFISLGNHEYYKDKYNKKFEKPFNFIKKLKNIKNLYLLDNENKTVDNINFIGLTLPIEYYFKETSREIDFSKYLKGLKIEKDKYNILLCHSPINLCNKKVLENSGIDLVLCGHMHGGITPRFLRMFMKNRGFISPTKTIFPKNAYGHIKIDKTDIMITSGITVVSHINKFRILKDIFSSEIVTLTLNKKI